MTVSQPRICTSSGHLFNPLDPCPDDIRIEDIAHHLGNICRYGGATREFYSVAQHSVLVSQNVDEENALWGLLHDASEAYIGDIVAPLKVQPEYKFYLETEDRLMEAVCERFDLPLIMPAQVKEYDLIVRATEMRDISAIPQDYWGDILPLEKKINPWTPGESRDEFLANYYLLTS